MKVSIREAEDMLTSRNGFGGGADVLRIEPPGYIYVALSRVDVAEW